jgi:hypothetical protein
VIYKSGTHTHALYECYDLNLVLIWARVLHVIFVDEVPYCHLLLVVNLVMNVEAHLRLRPVLLIIVSLMLGFTSHKDTGNAACDDHALNFMSLGRFKDSLGAL